MRHAVIVSFYSDLIPRHKLMEATLVRNGWRVSTITWNRSGESGENSGGNSDIRLAACSRSTTMLFRMPVLYWNILKILRKLRPDMLLLTHYFLLPVTLFVSDKSLLRIYDAPEYFCRDIPGYFGRFAGMAKHVIRLAEKFMVRSVDGIFAVDSRNNWFADYYRNMGKRVEVLLNVPSIKDDINSNVNTDAYNHGKSNCNIVAYAGALKSSKGLLTILRVVNLVRKYDENVLFEFIGPWQTDRNQIEAEVERLDITKHVRFIGPCSYREMLSRLTHATVALALLQGERYEYSGHGNSRKIFTYMQAGLPIVASDIEACALIEEIGCGKLVNINSLEDISRAIYMYLSDKELAAAHGASGREAFEEKYNWSIEENRFIEHIMSLDHKEKMECR